MHHSLFSLFCLIWSKARFRLKYNKCLVIDYFLNEWCVCLTPLMVDVGNDTIPLWRWMWRHWFQPESYLQPGLSGLTFTNQTISLTITMSHDLCVLNSWLATHAVWFVILIPHFKACFVLQLNLITAIEELIEDFPSQIHELYSLSS